jgi:hypothetical protein
MYEIIMHEIIMFKIIFYIEGNYNGVWNYNVGTAGRDIVLYWRDEHYNKI